MKRFLACAVVLCAMLFIPAMALSSTIPILEVISPDPTSYTYLTDFTQGEFSAITDVTAGLQYAGIGDTAGFSAFLYGNIALVQRSTLTFVEITQNAQSASAYGVIIFNNEAGVLDIGGDLPANPLAVMGTTLAIGNDLQYLMQISIDINKNPVVVHMVTVLDPPSSVPEPSTMLLLGSGLVGLVGYGRRRLKK